MGHKRFYISYEMSIPPNKRDIFLLSLSNYLDLTTVLTSEAHDVSVDRSMSMIVNPCTVTYIHCYISVIYIFVLPLFHISLAVTICCFISTYLLLKNMFQ